MSTPTGPRPIAAARVDVVEADRDHVTTITAIYAHYVRHATCTFELDPPDADEMAGRLAAVKAEGLPALVALDPGGALLGYAYAAPYRARPAYRRTVENSVYVAPGHEGRGIGRRLLDALVTRCREAGRTQIVAVIGDSANAGSIALHARAGFRHVGTLQDVGWKFGRWLDTVLMQRDLRDSATVPPLTTAR